MTDAIFDMVTTEVMATTEDVKRYFAYAVQEVTIAEIWKRDLAKNITALILGYLFRRLITRFSNEVIEHVLLNNFPAISREWCMVPQGQDQNTSRLRRTQEKYLKGVCLATVLLRWPGWYLHKLHLWECVRVSVATFAACQAALIGLLLVVHGLICIGEKLARLTDWDPTAKTVHFDSEMPATPPRAEMPRKHPSSVGMGRFLNYVKLDGLVNAKDTFIAREWNGKKQEIIVYHAITTQEQHWDFSFEELRLQDYEKTGKFVALRTVWQSTTEEVGLAGSTSVRRALPTWLSSRTFRESAFDASTSSFGSDVSIDRLNASLAAGMASSPDVYRARPDLLTEEGTASKCFT